MLTEGVETAVVSWGREVEFLFSSPCSSLNNSENDIDLEIGRGETCSTCCSMDNRLKVIDEGNPNFFGVVNRK